MQYYVISAKHIYICITFYLYSRIGTGENNMKIKMWTLLLTTIRKARNHSQDADHCQDEDHCQYHLVIDHCQDTDPCQDGNENAEDQDMWSALNYINPSILSYHDHKLTMFNHNNLSIIY